MNQDDIDIALGCLTLAADLLTLDSMEAARRVAVLAEASTPMELVAEVFIEPEQRLPNPN